MSSVIKYIFFDCMETLVDLTQLPKPRDYALWAFDGSGTEDCWPDFDSFYNDYQEARKAIAEGTPEYMEHELLERFQLIAQTAQTGGKPGDVQSTARKLYDNFWKTYVSKCYVADDVRKALTELKKTYRLGVVSNFVVIDGIEELLERNGILYNFDFVITSVREGWQKPHPEIYKAALARAGARPEDVVFVGDDYMNDYIAPKDMGMKPVFLDRFSRYPEIPERICDFYGLSADTIKKYYTV